MICHRRERMDPLTTGAWSLTLFWLLRCLRLTKQQRSASFQEMMRLRATQTPSVVRLMHMYTIHWWIVLENYSLQTYRVIIHDSFLRTPLWHSYIVQELSARVVNFVCLILKPIRMSSCSKTSMPWCWWHAVDLAVMLDTGIKATSL